LPLPLGLGLETYFEWTVWETSRKNNNNKAISYSKNVKTAVTRTPNAI